MQIATQANCQFGFGFFLYTGNHQTFGKFNEADGGAISRP